MSPNCGKVRVVRSGVADVGKALGPGQRRLLAGIEEVDLTPGRQAVDALDVLALGQQVECMLVDAEGAAVDLGGPQENQVDKLLADAGLAQRCAGIGERLARQGCEPWRTEGGGSGSWLYRCVEMDAGRTAVSPQDARA